MPEEGMKWLPRSEVMSFEEIEHLARIFVERYGVDSIRLTGGGPTVRAHLPVLIAKLAALRTAAGPIDLAMTTNAATMRLVAGSLREAGLRRVNISLDTLDRARFMELTRRDKLVETLAGIAAADAAGLHPVKINAVAMRGVNDDEVVALTRFAVDRGYQMRFIEQMPLDGGHTWDRTEMVTQSEILDRLTSEFTLTEVEGRGAAPAELWYVDGGPQTVGVIASVTAPFCGACDRLRLTADGQLRACLFSEAEVDTRVILRDGGTDDDLADAYRRCLAGKRAAHGIGEPGFHQPDRPMSAIGG
jgi:GTP 3',8-cyclase